MIRSNTHAFEILESPQPLVPYDAIRYLYDQPPARNIRNKVFFWIKNAYNEAMFISEEEELMEAPIWFGIIAENYLEEDLIDPVIDLFTTVDDDWDLLNEQGAVLIQKLCEKLGDVAIEKFLNKTVEQIAAKSEFPYLYLFECFRFVDPAKYEQQILSLFAEKPYWMEAFLNILPDIQFSQKRHPALLEKIQEKLALLELEYEMMDTLDHIDERILSELKACQASLSKADYPNTQTTPSWERGDWETHYRKFEKRYDTAAFEEEETLPSPISIPEKVKISRNAPCPCGSGKKYKRCCLE